MNQWLREMNVLAGFDYAHREAEKKVNRLEPGYFQILAKLPRQEQDIVEAYVAACEDLQYTYARSAYQLGWRNGALNIHSKGPRKEKE